MNKRLLRRASRLAVLAAITAVAMLGVNRVKASTQVYTQPIPIYVVNYTAEVKPSSPISTDDLGEFKLTFYDACVPCTGSTKGITRSGAKVTKDLTVAVDPSVIPLGSLLYIEGFGFRVAQDTGGAIKGSKIDIYVPTHSEAVEKGVQYAKVYIIKEEKK